MMRLLFLFFILISLNTFSQSIDLGQFELVKNTCFDKDKKEVYIFYEDSLSVIDLVQFKRTKKIKLESTNGVTSNPIVCLNSQIYFIEGFGGKVYKLVGSEIVRIDNSFTHKMQINSTIFTYNDTIYRYGGYGFWSQRNFFTFYNTSSNEWDVLPPIGSKVVPQGSHSSEIIINKDDFYIFGGLTLNPLNPLEYQNNKDVWKFNIKNKSWSKLGETKLDFSNGNVYFTYNNKLFYHKLRDHIYIVDVLNNNISSVKITTLNNKIVRKDSFFYDGVLYFFAWKPNSEGYISLSKINENELIGNLKKEGPFYHNNQKTYYVIGIIGVFIFLIISYFQIKKRKKKRNKIISENGHLIFKRRILNFNKISIQIINLLLKSEKEVVSKDIMCFTEKQDLNYGHNTRVMNLLIDEINFKLREILHTEEDIITFKKSKLDKRIKVYSIKKDYFYIK